MRYSTLLKSLYLAPRRRGEKEKPTLAGREGAGGTELEYRVSAGNRFSALDTRTTALVLAFSGLIVIGRS